MLRLDPMRDSIRQSSGFTLIEAVIVIAITGIIAAVVAVFIKAPVQGYFDAARRAEITDVADSAVRRFARDIHLALPNSVRVLDIDSTHHVLEFLPVRLAGRYRADPDASGGGDPLDFSMADTTFDVLGPQPTMQSTDQIVIYNLGIPGADAYEGNTGATHNRRAYSGVAASVSNIQIASSYPFPFDSPNHSFFVVDFPVAYKCDTTAQTLTRYYGNNYPINATQVDPSTISGVSSALVAKNVTGCAFTYTPGATQRNGLVTLTLSITQQGETVSLYQQVLVNNVP